MSLDRNHIVFRGNPGCDRTPPRYLVRSLDDEIGSRASSWKYQRYICILGDQDTGRRSLAKRFYQGRGELKVDGNYWVRGRIPYTNGGFCTRGQLDLLIRIVPSPEEEMCWRSGYGRTLVAAGIHGNAALFIFAFECARLRSLRGLETLLDLLFFYMKNGNVPSLVVGTKCDLRDPDQRGYLSEGEIKQEVAFAFRRHWNYPRPPPYVECSVAHNVNVDTVINEALFMI